LIAGDIDYALGGVSSVLRARMRGADPVIVAGTANVTGQRVMVRPDSPLQRFQDCAEKLSALHSTAHKAIRSCATG
jgi:ABC-type nitrate/sulfonate/bicarbonate transport system substrate-binding protein